MAREFGCAVSLDASISTQLANVYEMLDTIERRLGLIKGLCTRLDSHMLSYIRNPPRRTLLPTDLVVLPTILSAPTSNIEGSLRIA
jgi:hypothetical protein